MPNTLTEDPRTSEALVSEASGTRSRDTVTVLSGQTLKANAVLGKITASGKFVAVDPVAVDGSEVAAGVLSAAVDASAADKAGVAFVRDCEVNRSELGFGTLDAGEQAAAVSELAAAGIIAR